MANRAAPRSKFVRTPQAAEAEIPHGAILLGLLRTAECEMERRGLLSPTPNFSPLWFLGETERNVFLWLNGFSLADAEDFQFWVDIPALIDKRVNQLERYNSENPFLNPLWGSPASDTKSAVQELDYLTLLKELFTPILIHAHALSCLTELVIQEAAPSPNKPAIVLPLKAAQPA